MLKMYFFWQYKKNVVTLQAEKYPLKLKDYV